MWNIKYRIKLKDKRTGIKRKKAFSMIFKEFCSSHMKYIIEEHHEYDININDPLKIMDEIYQSMHRNIRATYPYLSLTEYFAKMTSTRQQWK